MSKVKIDLTPRDLMRAQDVKRWQIVRVREPQSVAQHSWAVSIIAQLLWKGYRDICPNHMSDAKVYDEQCRIANAAIWHDVPEVFTGDINTPTKIYIKEKLADWAALEDLEDTAGDNYTTAMGLTEPQRVCLKLADFLEAIHYLKEHGDGNYAAGQLVGLAERMREFCGSMQDGDLWWTLASKMDQDLNIGPETTTFERVNAILAQRRW